MKISPFDPEPVEVIAVSGRPVQVTVRKKRQRARDIVNIWRVDDTWWQRPVARMYYTLELESGSRVTVFQDLSDGVWYRQNWTV
ncbi:MAG: hypothetical protein GXX82_16735 [Syntrophorhabdus sp.]|jgi:hypothetical protein|nr:hypothetical protein [Syntrophorhabdus sp.]